MITNKGLTRVDAIIVVACVALVLAQAGIINAGGRERSKREVCLSNLRTLTAAWKAYADDNAGKIVNGATPSEGYTTFCVQCPNCPAGPPYISKAKAPVTGSGTGHDNELPWVGGAYYNGAQLPECAAKCAIETGALYKYVQDFEIYRCPTGNTGEYLTYTFVDAMNGMPCPPDCGRGTGLTLIKNRNSITKTATRIVFMDEGKVTPDSFAVYYNREQWWDPPPVRHSGGVCVSFADGHSAFHKWKSQETITIGSGGTYFGAPTCVGKNDLYWMQIGCWGQLGYTPTCPVNTE